MERYVAIFEEIKKSYPDKFATEEKVFESIRRGDHLFVSTGCGEPQYLIAALAEYIDAHPKAFFDTEVFQVWTLGVAPYDEDKFKRQFRHNSFFIGDNTRDAVNAGLADYTPIFLSQVPELFYRRYIPIDVALIQTSPPDNNGFMSLGVSVDISKAAVEIRWGTYPVARNATLSPRAMSPPIHATPAASRHTLKGAQHP